MVGEGIHDAKRLLRQPQAPSEWSHAGTEINAIAARSALAAQSGPLQHDESAEPARWTQIFDKDVLFFPTALADNVPEAGPERHAEEG